MKLGTWIKREIWTRKIIGTDGIEGVKTSNKETSVGNSIQISGNMREDDKTFLNLGMNMIQKLTKIGKINDTDTTIYC